MGRIADALPQWVGCLIQAGREIQPSGVPKMIQGIVLVCLIGSDLLLRYRVRFLVRRQEA
jgi:hypothetical protein